MWELDLTTGTHRTFASGLRNPVGMAWEPISGALWVAVNERDELGHDLVPDYMTAVKDGGFYGWPFSYFGANVDDRVDAGAARPGRLGDRSRLRARRAHRVAGPGREHRQRPRRRRGGEGMFVGQHGSWNRTPRSGYKVIFVPFEGGRPAGPPRDVLSGFVTDDGDAMGRPVGVAVDSRGGLLVADDVGNVVWRVTGVVRTTTLEERAGFVRSRVRPAQRPARAWVSGRRRRGVTRAGRAIVELGTGRLRDRVVLGAMHAAGQQRADRRRVVARRVAVELDIVVRVADRDSPEQVAIDRHGESSGGHRSKNPACARARPSRRAAVARRRILAWSWHGAA